MKLICMVVFVFIAGCGYSSRDNELIAQVKKVEMDTPLICPDFSSADLSLGVMRSGVGSMSSQDVWMYIPNKENLALLQKANESGDLVKVKYDEKRITFCVPHMVITSVSIIK